MIATADRQTLSVPGLIRDVPADVYHALDCASASRLNALRRSPMHCKFRMENPETTAAMELGTAVHTLTLEAWEFSSRYLVAETCYRTKRDGNRCEHPGKAFVAGEWLCGVHAGGRETPQDLGRTIIAEADVRLAHDITASISRHPDARRLLDALTDREVSVLWTDRQTGAECKGRIDGLGVIGGQSFILDLKTTTDASPRAFSRTIYERGYHVQGALYADGLAVNGVDVESVWFVAVETDAPHAVGVYPLAETALAVGRAEAATLLATWAECRRSGEWRGYETAEIDLPRYAYREE